MTDYFAQEIVFDMIGHKQALQFFENAIAKDTLSHAYLLVGPAHVGKRTLADTVVAQLTNSTPARLTAHADVRIVAREMNEKTGKLRKDISVDQIRAIRSFAASGPMQSDWSAIIVDGAELLNKQAANSLLKTLEEPHKKTIIFLTTTDEALLPPTIVSRSQIIYLHPQSNDVIQAAIASNKDSAAITAAAVGLPGMAYLWSTDAEAWESYKQSKETFLALFGVPLYQKRAVLSEWFEKKEDHIAGRAAIQEQLSYWQLYLREMLLTGNNSMSRMQAVQMYDTIQSSTELLKKNVHPKAVVDSMLLIIP